MRIALVSAILAVLLVGCGPLTGESDAATTDGDTGAVDAATADAEAIDDAGAERDAASASASVGSACSADTQCPAGGSGVTTCVEDWPGGYCTVIGCAEHGHDCPDDPGLGGTATSGSKCVFAPEGRCLALCASDADCRPDYECAPRSDAAGHATTDVCVPRST